MTGRVERHWVQLIDSGRWRRALGSSTVSRVRSTSAYRSLDLTRRSMATRLADRRAPGRFSQVEVLCVFIGHVKSGGSLLGSMLDAHPEALVSDEVDLLRYLEAGFGREQLCHLVEKGSRREAMKGRVTARRLDPYSLAVPGSSQGRATCVRVLGDVRAGPTTRRLGEHPDLLDRLERTMAPTQVRFVHVVRDPFDPISAMVRRGQRTFSNAIADYTAQCERLLHLRGVIPAERLLTVRYESFTRDPVGGLTEVCGFLGLEPHASYLAACAAVVQGDRAGERTSVDWSEESIGSVEALIETVPFLSGYAWR
jgi:hypothetical protein